jgi:hypothetical protein
MHNFGMTLKPVSWIGVRARFNRSFQAPSLVQLAQTTTPPPSGFIRAASLEIPIPPSLAKTDKTHSTGNGDLTKLTEPGFVSYASALATLTHLHFVILTRRGGRQSVRRRRHG